MWNCSPSARDEYNFKVRKSLSEGCADRPFGGNVVLRDHVRDGWVKQLKFILGFVFGISIFGLLAYGLFDRFGRQKGVKIAN